ncbi:C protein [Carollia bat paramyxovirus]|nr:C protein [Carollia bat paramyxovirus]
MESRLSNSFRRIRNRFRRPMGGQRYSPHQQEQDQLPGRSTSRTTVHCTPDPQLVDYIRERITKEIAMILIEIMDHRIGNLDYQIPPKEPDLQPTLTVVGLVRTILGIMAENGYTLNLTIDGMIESGVLSPQELMNLRQAIPKTRLLIQKIGEKMLESLEN